MTKAQAILCFKVLAAIGAIAFVLYVLLAAKP